MLKILVLSAVFSLGVSVSAYLEERVVFGSFPIPLMVIDENTGVFIELVKAIGQRANLDIEIYLAPPKRATLSFANKKTEVLFPAINSIFTPDQKYLKSRESFYVRKDFAFTRKNGPLLNDIKSLEGKTIGLTRGYTYSNALLNNTKIRFSLANRDESNVRKLLARRIDAFVVEEKSGLNAFLNTNKASRVQYDKFQPVSKEDIFFAFHDNARGRRLESLVSKAIREMKHDHSFDKIMARSQ
ncbi:MAG: transporter substrate-binding domain-containing protein [Desulfobacter sp.]|nr:transporter substrate-binding domain-containing protein [Desulfobacter sp.]WDP83779.1 MAG: transporter substrate-binding domain-containing protein [Desulfobacter sp.]